MVAGGSALATGTPVWFATSAGMAPGDGSLATVVAAAEGDVVAIEPDVTATRSPLWVCPRSRPGWR